MISASCPSCGAPLTYRSAAAVTAVCPQCHSTVARTDDAVRKIGEVAAFVRELSPLQVGARGVFDGRRFEVVGVVRRERAAVRWNEWYVLFDDGRDGWLGESNGQTWIFANEPAILGPADISLGAKLKLEGKSWVAAEVGEAEIRAAEGELPFDVYTGRRTRYADLKRSGGEGVGTIDFEEEPPKVWVGVVVGLPALKMEGLRPFVGWSDPVLTAFAGPELTATQSLACTSCGAPLIIRAPGASRRRVCEYCGTVIDIDSESGDPTSTAVRAEKDLWKPPFALGTRTTIAGVEWEIIGAMQRAVREELIWYPWHEYLLHNPWRGFRWLVEANGHLSVVDLLAGSPAEEGRDRQWAGTRYHAFQSGDAVVQRVVGEFTWEVARGDQATTMDFIAPPRMLSAERSADEITWSLGTYLPWSEVQGELAKMQLATQGVAPHEPNPEDDPSVVASNSRRSMLLGVLVLAAIVAYVAMTTMWSGVVHTQSLEPVAPGDVVVSEPFTASGPPGRYRVEVVHPSPKRDVIVSLLSLDEQRATDVVVYGGTGSDYAALSAGTYVARVEVKHAGPASTATGPAAPVKLTVSRDAGGVTCLVLSVLFAALTVLMGPFARSRFEHRRWSTSSHQGSI